MENLECPACGSAMETLSEPDIEIEVCTECGGRFLDKGELDALATGLAGEIEYCSIDTDPHEDAFPTRKCPKCPGQDMRKINLLRLSEIIFDHCPQCAGFFLDKGETAAMNWELTQLSGTSFGEERRDTVDGHLVRINRLGDVFVVGWEFGATAAPIEYFQVVAYFRAPLSVGLQISREPWRTRLSKAFGLFEGQDIEFGDEAFDQAFVVQGENDRGVRKLLSPELRAALLAFETSEPRLLSQSLRSRLTQPVRASASLTVRDDRIEYLEGPYATSKATPDAETVVQDLLKLTALFERDMM
ncbi:MAG: TFIIB-type zinc ribbon-containing protein [Planctomycetota bacterium]|jgi:Zn-finger nucleic acid-binding protein